MNASNLHVKAHNVLKARVVSCAPPIVLSRGAPSRWELSPGNTVPVVYGRYACEALPHAFNICMFKYGKSNSTTIKHIYNQSENLNESCDVAFESNNQGNIP